MSAGQRTDQSAPGAAPKQAAAARAEAAAATAAAAGAAGSLAACTQLTWQWLCAWRSSGHACRHVAGAAGSRPAGHPCPGLCCPPGKPACPARLLASRPLVYPEAPGRRARQQKPGSWKRAQQRGGCAAQGVKAPTCTAASRTGAPGSPGAHCQRGMVCCSGGCSPVRVRQSARARQGQRRAQHAAAASAGTGDRALCFTQLRDYGKRESTVPPLFFLPNLHSVQER